MKIIEVGNKKWPVQVDDDFVRPHGYSLSVSAANYVKMLRCTGERRPSGTYVYEEDYLHRWIAAAPKGKVVLFIDNDRLNLQRENLLVCDRAISIRHTGGRSGRFKGVHFSKKQMKWIAQITCNYKTYHLGGFDTEEAAASAYNQAAVRLYGAYSYVNIMPEDSRGN